MLIRKMYGMKGARISEEFKRKPVSYHLKPLKRASHDSQTGYHNLKANLIFIIRPVDLECDLNCILYQNCAAILKIRDPPD